MEAAELAAMIDHTVLKPDTLTHQVYDLCNEAREYGFATVCVPLIWVQYAARQLEGTNVGVATVVGFPHGNTYPAAKGLETQIALVDGATEIDMVINISALKTGDEALVIADIEAVVNNAKDRPVKVIFETALLTEEEKLRACRISKECGAAYVKTSTGFASGGATVEDVELMRRAVGDKMGVKASGGIRDLDTALKMIEAGASRLGCSASVSILNEFQYGKPNPPLSI